MYYMIVVRELIAHGQMQDSLKGGDLGLLTRVTV